MGAPNPLAAMLMRATQGGGPGGGMPPGVPGGSGMPGGPGGDEGGPGPQLSQLTSELNGADPGYMMKEMQQLKQAMMALFVRSGMRLPNVSGQIAMAMKQWDRAIKEVQQAATTQGAVSKPLGFSAAGTGEPQAGPATGGF